MTMREKIRNRALECEGKHRSAVGCAGDHDWCAHFVSNVLKFCGITDVFNTFVGPLRDDMLKSGKFYEPEDYPKFGDIISIDWDHKIEARPLDHVVICVDFNPDTHMITYINGNGSSSEYVTKQTISVDNPDVMYWTRYKEEDETVAEAPEVPAVSDLNIDTVKFGSKGTLVKTMQVLLVHKFRYELKKYGCDSDFGAESKEALMKFQHEHGLTPDGICGPKTWSKLIN